MWILIIKKLPVENPPPFLSIQWSVPWPDPKYAKDQKKRNPFQEEIDPSETHLYLNNSWCAEPNWIGARRVRFGNQDVRIFPHEFVILSLSSMKDYIFSGAHELVPDNTAEELLAKSLKGIRRSIYEAALIDGCNEAQAKAVAFGVNITKEEIEFPPIGWYKCRKECADFFAGVG